MPGPTDRLLWTRGYKRLRLLVLDRDRWTCQVRGPGCKGYATEVDHVIPRMDGGSVYDMANLRASCRSCNAGRANHRRGGVRRSVPTYEVRL
jgi:5-methylcytosine-specific restriction endonuclease McrA